MRSLLYLTIVSCVVLPGLTGCIAFYSTRPVEIQVNDSKSSEPVSHAHVSVRYLYALVLNAPSAAAGNTDAAGIVVLPIADFDNGRIVIGAEDTEFDIEPASVRDGGSPGPGRPVFGREQADQVRIHLRPLE